jgi:hypothetical protein
MVTMIYRFNPLQWLKLEALTIPIVDEDMEQLEHTNTASGNVTI